MLADQKASIILAATGVIFSAFMGVLIAKNWGPSTLHGYRPVIWWFGAGLAICSVVSAASAVWPRYSKSDLGNGITYWGHVASFDNLLAFSKALDATPLDNSYRVRHQLWHMSRVVNRKYNLIRFSLTFAGFSAVCFMLAGF